MSPAKPSESDDAFVLRLPRHSLQIVAAAFVIGLLLFLLVWWKAHDEQFYTVEPVAAPEAALPEALPEPLSGGMSTSRMQVPETASDGEHPQLVETTPPPPPPAPIAPSPATPATPSPPPVATRASPLAAGDAPEPIPGQMPAPEYPVAAARRGASGTVVVRVEVGADGVPVDVSVAQRSGSRDLDRAALRAVRQWRFKPAQRDGQAVAGSVDVPVEFNLR